MKPNDQTQAKPPGNKWKVTSFSLRLDTLQDLRKAFPEGVRSRVVQDLLEIGLNDSKLMEILQGRHQRLTR